MGKELGKQFREATMEPKDRRQNFPTAGARSQEPGARSQESGARSRESGVQEHPTGKAREDLRSNWRSAGIAVAEKLRRSPRPNLQMRYVANSDSWLLAPEFSNFVTLLLNVIPSWRMLAPDNEFRSHADLFDSEEQFRF
jgi:hypothetical protein